MPSEETGPQVTRPSAEECAREIGSLLADAVLGGATVGEAEKLVAADLRHFQLATERAFAERAAALALERFRGVGTEQAVASEIRALAEQEGGE